MADQPLFDVFKEPEGLFTTHEPYEKPTVPNPRYQGKQFLVSDTSAVSGNGPDSWFDRSMQLASPSDSYIERLDLPTIVAARTAQGLTPEPSTGRPLHDKPFRPSNPAPKAGKASGAHYGTFGPMSMFLVAPDGDSQGGNRPTTAPVDNSRGNIYTSNPKRAGPGYPDQYRILSGQAYDYVPDEYQRGRILEKALKQEARARIHKPFMGGTRASGVFTPDSELYSKTPNQPPLRSRSANTGLPAWRPNNPPTKGSQATFSSPSYIPCPEPKEKPQLQLRPSVYAPVTPPFMPSSGRHKRLSMWSVNPYERGPRQQQQQPQRSPALARKAPATSGASAAATPPPVTATARPPATAATAATAAAAGQ